MTFLTGALVGARFASKFLNNLNKRNEALQKAQGFSNQAYLYQHQAHQARVQGAKQEDEMRAKNRDKLSSLRVGAEEAGMGESSTMNARLATVASGLEQEVLDKRYQTETAAQNYLYQADVAKNNVKKARKKAENLFQLALISYK